MPIVLEIVSKDMEMRLEEVEIRSGTGNGGLRNKRMIGDHPNYNIIKIGPNTDKSPGDLRRFPVTQIPREDHQLMLV